MPGPASTVEEHSFSKKNFQRGPRFDPRRGSFFSGAINNSQFMFDGNSNYRTGSSNLATSIEESVVTTNTVLGTHVWSILPTSIFPPLTLYYISFIPFNLVCTSFCTQILLISTLPHLDICGAVCFSVSTRLGYFPLPCLFI